MQKPTPVSNFAAAKGKSIYAVLNLCQTLDWLVSAVNNLAGGNGIAVDGVNNGKPVISAKLLAGDNVNIAVTPKGSLKISASGGGLTIGVGGTDYADVGKITFASASDSAVTFAASRSGNDLTLTIGVHYAD